MTSEELVSVVGNLIDNSIDAVKNDGTGEVYIKIFEDNEKMEIIVKDNGPGIPEGIRENIYQLGVSSKEGSRGFGMYIVKKIIDEANGNIDFKVDEGTKWSISMPMKRS